MDNNLILKNIIEFDELSAMLRKIIFRGLYDKNGANLNPYADVEISIATVHPPKRICASPKIETKGKVRTLFSPQPTIYQNQLDIFRVVDKFLQAQNIKINELAKAIEYHWEGRGDFHMLPPIIEKHVYDFKDGYFDLEKLSNRFDGTYVKDARGNLHELSERFLNNFYIDEVSKIDHLDIFHSNAPLINYGLPYSGKQEFYVICDGSHRIDYATEILREPISVIVIEAAEKDLIPYYAFPVPVRPTIRLSSKRAEKMYPRLERDKIHLFNDFINKILHYDWTQGGLNVSKLRSNKEIN